MNTGSDAIDMKNLQPQQKFLAKIKIQQLLYEVDFPQHHPIYLTWQDYYGRYNYEHLLPLPPNQ